MSVSSSATWRRYYAAVDDTPRATLLDALARHEAEGRPPGSAVDVGCGSGRDTLELLRRGWRVLAVDAEPRAFELLAGRHEARVAGDRLATLLARFEHARWPQVDLVNASFALPFCAPDAFAATWVRVVGSLRPGGRFCGQLFGDRDGWADADDMTFHRRGEAEALLDGLVAERFEESETDGVTAVGAAKHWHVFHVVARRP